MVRTEHRLEEHRLEAYATLFSGLSSDLSEPSPCTRNDDATALIDQLLANPHEGPGAQDEPISQYDTEMIGDSLRRKLIPGRDLK